MNDMLTQAMEMEDNLVADILKEREKRIREAHIASLKKKLEEIAEIIYIRDMKFDGWNEEDIKPFKEIDGEYREELMALAKKFNNMIVGVVITPTGGGI